MIKIHHPLLSLLLVSFLLVPYAGYTQTEDSTTLKQEMLAKYLDSVNKSIKYEQGKVAIKDIAVLDVSDKYKFIPADKAK